MYRLLHLAGPDVRRPIREGRHTGAALVERALAGTQRTTLLPPGEEVDGRTAANFAWLTAAVSPEIWSRCQILAGTEGNAAARLTVCRLLEPQMKRIRQRFRACQAILESSKTGSQASGAATEASAMAADVFVSLCECAGSIGPVFGSLRNRARLARRAEEWMRAHLGEPVQVQDVCLALRVSRRELEYAFRTVLDESPRDHLQALRLNAIRRVLLHTGGDRETITRIAHEHGLSHLGRFAASNRALFGETPHETRRG